MNEELIPKHGGYRKLRTFQIAQLIYDLTVRFCDRYINPRSRTHDQMVQAARSGVQNIAEGSQVSGTSKKIEMKLTNVARASLEELRLDYEDFLRQRGLTQWEPNDPKRQSLIDSRPKSVQDVNTWAKNLLQSGQNRLRGKNMMSSASKTSTLQEIAANTVLTLINVATALLYRQLIAQAEAFKKEGGFTEHLYKIRSQYRKKGNS